MIFEPILLEGPYNPVKHYYGDLVRQLFIAAAVVMLVGSPFYADTLSSELPFEIFAGLILVALAAFTNPHGKTIMMADAIASGAGLLVYELWALSEYATSPWAPFLLRQLIAVIFLAAFYFSMKTLRAMIMHKVGEADPVDEFDAENGQKPTQELPSDEEENIVHFKSEEIVDDQGGEHRPDIMSEGH